MLSILLSGSEERFPDSHVTVVANCLGFAQQNRIQKLEQLGKRHDAILADYGAVHTARTILF